MNIIQNGLEWTDEGLSSEPRWTKEPDVAIIERLARHHLLNDDSTPIAVTFFAQGGFNKLYQISAPGLDRSYLMRVALPVDPHYKSLSEAATMEFLKRQTSIPVPKIVASDPNNLNELGFEWILMELCDGGPLREKWRTMEWEKKKELVSQLARYQAQLFENRFEGIGNLYVSKPETAPLKTCLQPAMIGLKTSGQVRSTFSRWLSALLCRMSSPPRMIFQRLSSRWKTFVTSRPSTVLPRCRTPQPTQDRTTVEKQPPPPKAFGVFRIFTKLYNEGNFANRDVRRGPTLPRWRKPRMPQNPTPVEKQPAPPIAFTVSRIVSMSFFWGDHINCDIRRGPFRSSNEWLQTRLHLTIMDQEKIAQSAPSEEIDEDDIEDAQAAIATAKQLLNLLPTIFPPPTASTELEPTILFHDDLSQQNILVNKDYDTTAVIDWECVSTLPLWRACQFPHLLTGHIRTKMPIREQYAQDNTPMDPEDTNALDNQGVDQMYWEHMLQYERHLLRGVFLKTMKKLKPEWVHVMSDNIVKADFERCVYQLESRGLYRLGGIESWIESVKNGTEATLVELLGFDRGGPFVF